MAQINFSASAIGCKIHLVQISWFTFSPWQVKCTHSVASNPFLTWVLGFSLTYEKEFKGALKKEFQVWYADSILSKLTEEGGTDKADDSLSKTLHPQASSYHVHSMKSKAEKICW